MVLFRASASYIASLFHIAERMVIPGEQPPCILYGNSF